MLEDTPIVLGTIAALLPIVNPFSTSVVFIALRKDYSEKRKNKQALMACIYMCAILIVFLVAGVLIMNFFGISIPGVRIAGGLIITSIGFGMLTSKTTEHASRESEGDATHKGDIAFTPLAMPMLSGPGSIAVTIGMAANVGGILEYAAISLGIIIVAIISLLVLRASGKIVRFLGETGMNALNRIMGFLLVCVGIQFIVLGVQGFILDEELSRPVIDMIRKIW
jgi:multiple antibiotic resistance protein